MTGPVRKAVSLVVLVGVLAAAGRFAGLFGAGPVPVEIHYLLGDPPVCAGLEVAFTPVGPAGPVGSGEAVARFETSLVGPDVMHRTRLPGGTERLAITLVAAGGARRTVERTIEAERDAVIRIDLSREAI